VPTEKRQRQKEGRRARLEAQRKRYRRRQLARRIGFSLVGALVVVGIVLLVLPGSAPTKQLTAQQKAQEKAQEKAQAALAEVLKKDQKNVDAVAVAAGCPSQAGTPTNPGTVKQSWKHEPAMTINPATTYVATMRTTAGTVKIKLDPSSAPINVNNFVFLADHGFYSCNPFWRVIPKFMNQTGDPSGGGKGGPGFVASANEFPTSSEQGEYPIGTVAMANSCADPDTPATCPTTNGSQFFIIAGTGGGLPPAYTVIGHVISGMAAITKINRLGAVGKDASNGTGYPPQVLERILSVTIST
jgi:cyclophilin family peptidyl-prolyl cis-trans isomerase